jgi:hypothetical protein
MTNSQDMWRASAVENSAEVARLCGLIDDVAKLRGEIAEAVKGFPAHVCKDGECCANARAWLARNEAARA